MPIVVTHRTTGGAPADVTPMPRPTVESAEAK